MARLEAAAMDSLAEFFADPNKPKNAKKKPILKELFRVAKMEERYKRNEIGEQRPPPSGGFRKMISLLTGCCRCQHSGDRDGG